MPFTLDADLAATALEDRGYDVSRETAEDGGDRTLVTLVRGQLTEGSPRQVWLDAGGTLRMQITRQTDEAATRRIAHKGQQYKISREIQVIINIWTSLNHIDELGAILDDLESLPPSFLEEGQGEGAAPPIFEASTDVAPPLADEALMDKEGPIPPAPFPRREGGAGRGATLAPSDSPPVVGERQGEGAEPPPPPPRRGRCQRR